LFVREAAMGGFPAVLSCHAIQTAPLSLERQQEHRFFSISNASQCLRLDGLGCRQKVMPPAVCSAKVNSQGTRSV